MFQISFLTVSILIVWTEVTKPQTSRSPLEQDENTAPVVRITAPADNSIHTRNSLIRYVITVSDKEDGESKFDEIPSDKILLEIKFVSGASNGATKKKQMVSAGLSLIKDSDCLTCHHFRTPLTGPPFSDIAQRYAREPGAREKLAVSIREGSKGIWGEMIMPAHPDVDEESSRKIAQWILETGVNMNLNYVTGKQGTFRLEIPNEASEGFFILTATYTDKGLRQSPTDVRTGQDVVIIRLE